MAIKTDIVCDIPNWAVSYLENDDDSELTKEEKDMVDRYVKTLEMRGMRLICPIDGTYNEFCSMPAFGPACDTVDYDVELLKRKMLVEVVEHRRVKFVVEACDEEEAKKIAEDTYMNDDELQAKMVKDDESIFKEEINVLDVIGLADGVVDTKEKGDNNGNHESLPSSHKGIRYDL